MKRLILFLVLSLILPNVAFATTETFVYTGTLQTWTPPAGVASATISLVGAEGGNNGTDLGGRGGVTTGTISGLSPSTPIYMVIGAKPTSTTLGTYGGGGASGGGVNPRPGGGGTWISFNNTITVSTILLAAGGGGGACACVGGLEGGSGGGLTGGNGVDGGGANTHGLGGTQTAGGVSNGAALQGAAGAVSGQGGGGGGLYGGGTGLAGNGSGGGGAGHTSSTASNTSTANGVRLGDGFITITYTATVVASAAKVRIID